MVKVNDCVMRKFLAIAIIISIFIVGCSSEVKHEFNSCKKSLYKALSAFFSEQTRTYVEQDKYIYWHEGDCLTVFYADNVNNEYQFEGQTGDNGGTFTIVESGTSNATMTLNRIYAVYPYDSAATIAQSGDISYHLPTAQNYAKDSFGVGANTMVAATESVDDTELYFSNLCGYLKIKLYGNILVKSIELKGNAGEKIAGLATIAVSSDGLPTVSMNQDASKSIVLNCDDGVAIGSKAEKATTFWFVVPPITFAEGITITVTSTNDEVFEKSTNKPVVIDRNVIHPMAAFEVIGERSIEEVVRQTIDPIFNQCASVEEFKSYIDQIAEIDGVAEVGSSESVVYAVLDNGFTIAWGEKPEWPASADYISETFTQAEAMLKVQQNSSSHDFLGQNLASNKKLKVGILNQTSNDNTLQHPEMRDKFEILKTKFEKAGFEVYIVNHEQLSFEFFWTYFFNFDVILWHTHGLDVQESHPWFMCKTVEKKWCTSFDDSKGKGHYVEKNGTTYQMISENYLKCSPHKFGRGSIIFAAVCGSLKDDKKIVADVLINQKGASTYLGYDNTTCAASHASVAFFNSMLQGMTAMEAYEHLDEKYKEEDCEARPNLDPPQPAHTAKLHLIGNKDLCIVHPQVITNDAIVDGGMVTFNGVVTGWNDEIVGNVGFVWSMDSQIPTIESGCKYNVVDLKPSDSENNTTYDITKREIGFVFKQPYSYRAYAQVGGEYIYGDVRTFEPEQANNIIYYTTTDDNPIAIKDSYYLNILSNTYTDGVGMIVCGSDVVELKYAHFNSIVNLKTIVLPNSITSISNYGFRGCTALEEVVLPEKLTKLSKELLRNCTSLKRVNIPEGVTIFEGNVFEGCTSLESIRLPESIADLGGYAFKDCTSLKDVNLPDGITYIGGSTFCNCTSLERIIIPKSVTIFESYAFAYCSALEYIEIPDGVTKIGSCVFTDCSSLKEIYIPDSVVDLYPNSFENCTSLARVKLSRNLVRIESYLFHNCTSLTSIEIPDSVTSIGADAFENCTSLKSVTIPDGIERIGNRAFKDCSGPDEITIPASVIRLGVSAFDWPNLKVVHMKPITPPAEMFYPFGYSKEPRVKVYVPSQSRDAYYWQRYSYFQFGAVYNVIGE